MRKPFYLLKTVHWAALLAFALSSAPTSATATGPVTDLGIRRELFLDEELILTRRNVVWRMHQPEAREVVLTCDVPWEGNTSAYYTILDDNGLYRMYYRGWHFNVQTKKAEHPEHVCYAESRDGISWTRPELGLVEVQGSKSNNVIWTDPPGTEREAGVAHNFTPFLDTNPATPTTERFKALAGTRKGLAAFVSEDGVRWRPFRKDAVITRGAFDSQNLAFWDAHRGEYRAYWRIFTAGVTNEREWKPDGIRSIRTAVSKDFINWEFESDLKFHDAPSEHLYTNSIRAYLRAPHVFIGFPTRYQSKTQQVEPVLMSSRDGVRFKRWADPLIPITAPKDRDGNRSNYMTNALLELPGRPGEMSVYATEAYYTGPGSRVRRFAFRTDGFASMTAGDKEGEVVSGHVSMSGGKLSVNARTSEGGSVRVELQDPAGKPYPGFALEEALPFTGDSIDSPIAWKGGTDVSALRGKPLRLRWVLQKADLFSFRFE
jgi:hypothetical protein